MNQFTDFENRRLPIARSPDGSVTRWTNLPIFRSPLLLAPGLLVILDAGGGSTRRNVARQNRRVFGFNDLRVSSRLREDGLLSRCGMSRIRPADWNEMK